MEPVVDYLHAFDSRFMVSICETRGSPIHKIRQKTLEPKRLRKQVKVLTFGNTYWGIYIKHFFEKSTCALSGTIVSGNTDVSTPPGAIVKGFTERVVLLSGNEFKGYGRSMAT